MQAIILAAGMGKRLGKYTQDGTKCMVRVNGKSLIERALEALLLAGIKRVVLVVGYRAESLRAFLEGKFPELEIVYVTNEIYATTNNIYSLWLAREYLAADDTLLLESDLIFQAEILAKLVADPEPNLAVVSKFEAWMDGTVTMVDEERNIVSVIERAPLSGSGSRNTTRPSTSINSRREFSAAYYLPFLEAYLAAFGHNQYYEQVLKVLAFLEDVRFKAFPVSGRRWYEIDDPNDLAVAETIFSEHEAKLERMQARYGGYWRFPGLLDYCYLVNPYFPPKRLVKEMTSSFRALLTQYPSGAAMQGSLAGKVFGIEPDRDRRGQRRGRAHRRGRAALAGQGRDGEAGLQRVSRALRAATDRSFAYRRTRASPTGPKSSRPRWRGRHPRPGESRQPERPFPRTRPIPRVWSTGSSPPARRSSWTSPSPISPRASAGSPSSTTPTSPRGPGLLVIKSVSKSFGVPGITPGRPRLGRYAP